MAATTRQDVCTTQRAFSARESFAGRHDTPHCSHHRVRKADVDDDDAIAVAIHAPRFLQPAIADVSHDLQPSRDADVEHSGRDVLVRSLRVCRPPLHHRPRDVHAPQDRLRHRSILHQQQPAPRRREEWQLNAHEASGAAYRREAVGGARFKNRTLPAVVGEAHAAVGDADEPVVLAFPHVFTGVNHGSVHEGVQLHHRKDTAGAHTVVHQL